MTKNKINTAEMIASLLKDNLALKRVLKQKELTIIKLNDKIGGLEKCQKNLMK